MPGGVFCSDQCYQNMAAFQDRVKKLDEAKKSGPKMGKIITRAIVAIAGIAALYYVFIVEGVRGINDFLKLVRGLIP
jgi:hypothetical protein